MTIHPEALQLPAYAISERVNQLLMEKNRLIITAAPGAGKSTLLPLTIFQGLADEGKILLLEPRRLATKQIAERMSHLIGEKSGETVGYRVRFDKRVSEQTRIEVLTEGILTRMLINDPMLEGVSTIIFDEFHERSLHSDVALALAREIQQLVRPDLRIVIMSATIDATAIGDALQAPVVDCEGRMFPVQILHSEEDAQPSQIAEAVAHTIRKAHKEQEGDILAFLPGQAEILRCQELLSNALGGTHICPLYGQLSPQEQQRAIQPSPAGERKVVLATSIAETSLTIEGVTCVVDGGFCRTLVYDPRNGLSHLATQRISLDMATQRSGRAGRLCAGSCYRLWTLATEHRMEPCRRPEIEIADLSSTLLDVAVWGESDIKQLPWLTPPPAGNVAQAQQLLTLLDAIDTERKVTPLGRSMAELPCHPRIAKMLQMAQTPPLQALAADIAALLEEKDPLDRENDVDLNSRICLLRKARERNETGRWSRILRIAQEYRQYNKTAIDNSMPQPQAVGALIANAYPERIAQDMDGCGKYRLSQGGTAKLPSGDMLSSHTWLAIASMNAASGNIFLAAPLDIQDIAPMVRTKENISWDNKRGCLLMQQEKRIGSIVISVQPLNQITKEGVFRIICEIAPKEGLSLFDFNEEVEKLQIRIATVAAWHPELQIPDLCTNEVLRRCGEWIPFFAESNGKAMTTANEMKKIDLKTVIWSLLSYEQQQEIDRLAPTHITVPTGSKIRVDYRLGAEAPILSVRLQECFGLTDTPCVNDGAQPVLMELLSPGFKPVQLTQDLRSFWQGTYFEVKKELKRRYPKHYWPDNPLEAEAVRGVKRNKS